MTQEQFITRITVIGALFIITMWAVSQYVQYVERKDSIVIKEEMITNE